MRRLSLLQRITICASLVVMLRLFVQILREYRWYFPGPNFAQSDFLIGRESRFDVVYSAAFYAHIVASPIALLLGAFLVFAGSRAKYRNAHRLMGRFQIALVLLAVVPSGLVMAGSAYTGPIAGLGFAFQAIAVGGCAVASVFYAIKGKISVHQAWATRCFVLLCSPLLLRLISGVAVTLDLENHDWVYQANAWFSWVVPLACLEFCHLRKRRSDQVLNVHPYLPESAR